MNTRKNHLRRVETPLDGGWHYEYKGIRIAKGSSTLPYDDTYFTALLEVFLARSFGTRYKIVQWTKAQDKMIAEHGPLGDSAATTRVRMDGLMVKMNLRWLERESRAILQDVFEEAGHVYIFLE